MSTYLVTGGAGFIGSHLCDALLERGDQIRVLDDFSSGKEENLPPNIELIRGDVRDSHLVESAVEGIDGCFHLAAIVSAEQSHKDWFNVNQVNLGGFINVINGIRKHYSNHTVPIVYASSTAVYGNNPQLPHHEEQWPKPSSAYGVDKYACELHAKVAYELCGLPTVGLRIFNVYGPRQDVSSGVIAKFVDRAKKSEPLEVYGEGNQTRDFIYVEDVVAALIIAMSKIHDDCDVMNVCTGVSVSINQLIEMISKISKKSLDVVNRPVRKGEANNSLGSPEKAFQKYRFRARVPLEDGLKIKWSQA